MSGIVVTYELDGSPASPQLVEAMLASVRHRGPDASSTWLDGPVALGHCLLQVTDEDANEQPLHDGASGRVIVADARLDNRDELLGLVGAAATSGRRSDAALVLAAYDRWGVDCPQHLVGDFAFAIWDARERRLFCARDQLGVRPLYYHHRPGRFRCASEIDALFAERELVPRPHRASMALFLVEEYAETGDTLYEDVFALAPGSALVVTPASLRPTRYWAPNPWREVRHRSDEDYAAHFGETFREAVRCRLRSSRPVAAQVSGGIDSASVAVTASELCRDRPSDALLLVHEAFPGLPCDEDGYSKAVAERCRLPMLTAYPLDDADLCRPEPDRLPPDLYFHPTVLLIQPLLDIASSRGIRTTLTGVGSDQLMHVTGFECADRLKHADLAGLLRCSGLGDGPFDRRSWARVARGMLRLVPQGVKTRLRPPRPRREASWLTADGLAAIEADRRRREEAAPKPPRSAARRLWDVLVHDEVPSALAASDRISARSGAEMRHPFLDVRVVDLLMAFPDDQRVRGDLVKPVLRNAMNGRLPAVITQRRDAAEFSCYVEQGLFHPHRKLLDSLFEDSRLEELNLVNGREVRAMLKLSGSAKPLRILVNLVGMELWLRSSRMRGSYGVA